MSCFPNLSWTKRIYIIKIIAEFFIIGYFGEISVIYDTFTIKHCILLIDIFKNRLYVVFQAICHAVYAVSVRQTESLLQAYFILHITSLSLTVPTAKSVAGLHHRVTAHSGKTKITAMREHSG